LFRFLVEAFPPPGPLHVRCWSWDLWTFSFFNWTISPARLTVVFQRRLYSLLVNSPFLKCLLSSLLAARIFQNVLEALPRTSSVGSRVVAILHFLRSVYLPPDPMSDLPLHTRWTVPLSPFPSPGVLSPRLRGVLRGPLCLFVLREPTLVLARGLSLLRLFSSVPPKTVRLFGRVFSLGMFGYFYFFFFSRFFFFEMCFFLVNDEGCVCAPLCVCLFLFVSSLYREPVVVRASVLYTISGFSTLWFTLLYSRGADRFLFLHFLFFSLRPFPHLFCVYMTPTAPRRYALFPPPRSLGQARLSLPPFRVGCFTRESSAVAPHFLFASGDLPRRAWRASGFHTALFFLVGLKRGAFLSFFYPTSRFMACTTPNFPQGSRCSVLVTLSFAFRPRDAFSSFRFLCLFCRIVS